MATAGSFFASSAKTFRANTFDAKTLDAKPCFTAGNTGYALTGSASANFTVRIDNATARPDLALQLVDDAAAADFVLVDDGDAADACQATSAIKSIRIAAATAKADLTVTLSRAAANTKIYVRSANYSDEDAAALFAAIWHDARKAGVPREFAEHH